MIITTMMMAAALLLNVMMAVTDTGNKCFAGMTRMMRMSNMIERLSLITMAKSGDVEGVQK